MIVSCWKRLNVELLGRDVQSLTKLTKDKW